MSPSKLDLKKKRIRAFFLTLDTGIEGKVEKTTEIEDFLEEGLVYVQMRLPVKKITPEFEDKLKKSIESKIVSAKIREATEEDLPRLMDLYNKAWLTANTPFRPIDYDSLKTIFDDPDTVYLIASVYGIDGGFVILDYEGKNKEYGVIAGLGVIPRFQRKGLGTIIGLAAWEYFKKKGVEELRCEVYQDNTASYDFIKWIGFEDYKQKVYKKQDFELEI